MFVNVILEYKCKRTKEYKKISSRECPSCDALFDTLVDQV